MAVDGEPAAINFRKGGYLFIVPPAAVRVLERNFEMQKANGVHVEWLERKDLKARFPSMKVDDLGSGVFSPDDGWLDPYGVLQGLRKKAKALGADFVNDEVVALDVERRRLRAIRLKSGQTIQTDMVINTAGAWAKEICGIAGWTVPIEPMRRYEHYFETAEDIEPLPYIKDVHRPAFRPEGKGYSGAYQTSTSREGTTLKLTTIISSRLSGLRWPLASPSSSAPKKRIRCRVFMIRTSSTPRRSSVHGLESSTIFISWRVFPGMV
jgi:glycine/D-amino acid oxidase-like deaminating enzyme